jgi:hypothetical protein
MKTCIAILLLLPGSILFAQKPKQIAKYVKTVDMLKSQDSLQHFSYPNMSFCGGAIDGYYLNGKLVYIESTFQAELGYQSRKVYFKDTAIYKIVYREHKPEWQKYKEKYGDDLIPSKMTYADTLYTIVLGKRKRFEKTSGTILISKEPDLKLIRELVMCARRMKFELETERISHAL